MRHSDLTKVKAHNVKTYRINLILIKYEVNMETHLIGALVTTFSILMFTFIVAIREGIKIDKERHTGNMRRKDHH